MARVYSEVLKTPLSRESDPAKTAVVGSETVDSPPIFVDTTDETTRNGQPWTYN